MNAVQEKEPLKSLRMQVCHLPDRILDENAWHPLVCKEICPDIYDVTIASIFLSVRREVQRHMWDVTVSEMLYRRRKSYESKSR